MAGGKCGIIEEHNEWRENSLKLCYHAAVAGAAQWVVLGLAIQGDETSQVRPTSESVWLKRFSART